MSGVKSYEVLVGLNYRTRDGHVRAEPGEVVDDIPAKSIPWLLAQGCIKVYGKGED